VCFWRARDGVLIAGDVAFAQDPLGRARLVEPPTAFTLDVARNRSSLHRIAELRPSLAGSGHGPPLRDPGLLTELAARAELSA
jgi:hydroxyacylglutathione hydrolase